MRMLIGYARVSTADQDPSLQRDALRRAGCERIYEDVGVSGAKASRPELDRMMDSLREGDTVVVWKLDRLGRSLTNLLDLVNEMAARGVDFRSLTENMDTSTAGGSFVFNVFAAMAQFERDLIRERTNAGLAAARARGRKGGRPPVVTKTLAREIRRLYDERNLTAAEISKIKGVSRTSVYKALGMTRK